MWTPLFDKYGIEIDFAHRTFRWDSEATEKAHVHCVVIGFHVKDGKQTYLLTPNGVRDSEKVSGVSREQIRLLKTKTIYDGDRVIFAANICPYLIDAPTVFIESRAKPICDVPPMTYGNKPTDDGNLILSESEREVILKDTPALAPYVRRYVGSRDFINSDEIRYCLWLKDASPAVYHKNREVMRRIAAVRDFRLASSAAPTRKMAPRMLTARLPTSTIRLLCRQTFVPSTRRTTAPCLPPTASSPTRPNQKSLHIFLSCMRKRQKGLKGAKGQKRPIGRGVRERMRDYVAAGRFLV